MCSVADVSEAASLIMDHFDPEDGDSMYLRNIKYTTTSIRCKDPRATLATRVDNLS
jgi:hypothetical protein